MIYHRWGRWRGRWGLLKRTKHSLAPAHTVLQDDTPFTYMGNSQGAPWSISSKTIPQKDGGALRSDNFAKYTDWSLLRDFTVSYSSGNISFSSLIWYFTTYVTIGFHVPSNFFKQKPSWAFKLTSEILLNQYFGNPTLQDKFWLRAWHPGPSWSLLVSPDQFQTYWMFLAVLYLLAFLIPPTPTTPCPKSFLRHFKGSFPHPACSFCLPSITVCVPTSPVSQLSCFDLSASPLDLLLPGMYEVSSLCISRACPMSGFSGHRMGGAKQKGFSWLCVCILGKGQQMVLPGIQTVLMSLGSSSHGHLIALKSL